MWVAVLTVLGALALIYVGICAAYYLLQERLIFVRFPLSRDHRFKFKGTFEERFLSVEDGSELHALVFKADKPSGAILYFHGNTGTLRRWGKQARRFTRMGYEVWMPDPRGYGKSRGRLSEDALLDDAWKWYQEVLKVWPENKVVLYGRSLGSAMAVPTAARGGPRMLLLETPFAELRDPAVFYFRWIPYRLLLKYKFPNHEHIKGVRCPVYIFHGERDQVVPYASALRLYAHIPPEVQRELIRFPKGRHSDLSRFPRFGRKLRELLVAEDANRERVSSRPA
ncbi:MAG: alpha/beta fold hydrolase [Flavobacteriales bacterium]|nr:alpha/beta fold hydrolase [Flavobacteriales bacterium]